MKKLLSLFLLCATTLFAQQKQISLEDIWTDNTFSTERLNAFESMSQGDFYTILKFDGPTRSTFLEKYSYETLQLVDTIVNSGDLPDLAYFDSYKFSDGEDKLLLATQTEQIYRHSSKSIFYVYDIATKSLVLLTDRKVQEPIFSPDGNKVAYVYENNLFIKDLLDNATIQITFDGEKNKIINGITDWVYEEEFAFVRAFDWNGNSDKLAYMRFDESLVPLYTMDIYGDDLYPKQQVFKYPKAGENNSIVTVHIFNTETGKSEQVELGEKGQHYIPRMQWTNNNNALCVTTLNRHQNNLNLLFVNGTTLEPHLVLNEKDKAYIDITDNLTFLKDNSFIWTSEKDGYNHIYHHDVHGKLINQVTSGDWEVTDYYGYNPKSKEIYYQSTEDGSINRTIYSVKINGKGKKRLSRDTGTNSAAFSNSFNYFVNTYSDADTPYIYTLNNARNGKEIKEIVNNNTLLEKIKPYGFSKKEFFTIKTDNGEFNAWMIKPSKFNAFEEYPMLMFQYSGPGSQQVANRWMGSNDYWHQMLAQKGAIVVCVDGRGTGFKGADFKKATYLNLVKLETIDQIDAAKQLREKPYIKDDKIGIWGWSFGGHMSTNCILKGNDVFTMAIAVAPVTSWRFYDTIYTERFLRTPQENPEGYDENSPINYADMLEGDYLLIHGSGDDNVHVQNTMRMIDALIEANKPFQSQIYPDRAHGIYKGKNTRLHLYTKMTKFIEDHLLDD